MKKRLLPLLAAAMLCLSAFTFTACSENENAMADAAVDAVMSEVTEAVVGQPFIEDLTNTFLKDMDLLGYGLDMTEYVKSLVKSFDYSVNNVSIEGGAVTVDVTFTCLSLSDIEAEMTDTTEDVLMAAANLSASEMNAALGEAFTDAIAVCEPKQTNHTIRYDILNGTWDIDGGVLESALMNALTA